MISLNYVDSYHIISSNSFSVLPMFAQSLVGPAESDIVSQSTKINFNCYEIWFTYNVVGKQISIFPNFPSILFMAVTTFFHTILSFVQFLNRKKQKLKVNLFALNCCQKVKPKFIEKYCLLCCIQSVPQNGSLVLSVWAFRRKW